jgi:hypothetical protein
MTDLYGTDWEKIMSIPGLYGWIYPSDEEDGKFDIGFWTDFGSMNQNDEEHTEGREQAVKAVRSALHEPNMQVISEVIPNYQYTHEYQFYPQEYDPTFYKVAELPVGGPFGYVNGSFLAGGGHHQMIISELIKNGWTWEDLLTVPQAWGWIGVHTHGPGEKYLYIEWASDSGFQNDTDTASQYISNKYKLPVNQYLSGGVENPDLYGAGLSGKEHLQYYLNSDRSSDIYGDPIPVSPSVQNQTPPQAPIGFPPPKAAGGYRDPFYEGNPFLQNRNYDSWKNFISFVYLADRDELWIGGWGNNHDEVLARYLGDDWEENLDDVIELLKPTTVFGQIWDTGAEDVNNSEVTYRIDLNSSDALSDLADYGQLEGKDWREIPSNGALLRARNEVTRWLEKGAEETGQRIRISSRNVIAVEPTPRIVWAIDNSGKLHFSTAHPAANHADLPLEPEDMAAAGDFYIMPNNTARSRLLAYNLTNESKLDILSYVTAEFRRYHPYTKLEDIEDGTKGRASKVAATTEQVGDYTVIQMESGEYPRHDAIWIGRDHHIIVINYNGHHEPIFEEFPDLYENSETAAGHWRLEPSRTEPFGTGWGWHHGGATPEEEKIIVDTLKSHYNVQDLEHSFVDVEVEEPENEQLKLFAKKFAPPKITISSKSKVWLENPKEGFARPKPWIAEYDETSDTLIISEDLDINFAGKTKLAGFYKKIEKASGPQVARASELMEQALDDRYPLETRLHD